MSFRVTVTLPDKAEQFIDRLAANGNCSRSEAVRWLLPIFFWDATTGKPVPPGSEADSYPDYESSYRGSFR